MQAHAKCLVKLLFIALLEDSKNLETIIYRANVRHVEQAEVNLIRITLLGYV